MNIFDWISSFRFDRTSFILGFLAATLVWWLVRQFLQAAPRLQHEMKLRREFNRKRSLAYIEERFRQSTLRQAQSLHLACPLFALDEILIQPTLLSPPLVHTPDKAILGETDRFELIPHPLDWPEITAQYPYPRLSLSEAISKGANIAIVGEPGQGKTVALAYLAALLAKQDATLGDNSNKLPILLSVHDLDLASNLTPQDVIINSVLSTQPSAIKSSLARLLHSGFEHGDIILLVDGGDELGRDEFDRVSIFILKLANVLPHIQIAICVSSYYLGSLESAGFQPLVLSNWSQFQKTSFIEKWLSLWFSVIEPNRNLPEGINQLDPTILKGWAIADISQLSPLELTLKIWTLCAGDVRSTHLKDLLETYIRWTIPDDKSRSTLEEKVLTQITRGSLAFYIEEPENQKPQTNTTGISLPKTSRKINMPEFFYPLQRVRQEILDNGLIRQFTTGRCTLSNPLVAGYLAACSESASNGSAVDQVAVQPIWHGMATCLHFITAKNDLSNVVENLLSKDVDDPFENHLFMVSRWLRDLPATNPWRTSILKTLVDRLQNEAHPLSLRGRAIAALTTTDDPVVAMLIKQLLISTSPHIRQMAAIATGLLQDTRAISDLLGLLKDPDMAVKQCACMALAAIETEKSMQAIAQIILSGDELLSRVAAESLSMNPGLGQEVLRDGSTSDNLLVRRASVYGLARLSDSWATEILQKMAIDDAQWVVRSAVTQVLEDKARGNPFVPSRIEPAYQTPWLLAYAAKLESGIPIGSTATNILVQVTENGSIEERLAALGRLTLTPDLDDGSINSMYKLIFSGKGALSDAAMYAVWVIALRSVKLPLTRQFGMR